MDPNPYNTPILQQIGRTVLVVRHAQVQLCGRKPFKATIRAIHGLGDGRYLFRVLDHETAYYWWVRDDDVMAD